MSKIDKKVEELLAKHPSLTKPEAIKVLTEKNERKKKKRLEKTDEENWENWVGELGTDPN